MRYARALQDTEDTVVMMEDRRMQGEAGGAICPAASSVFAGFDGPHVGCGKHMLSRFSGSGVPQVGRSDQPGLGDGAADDEGTYDPLGFRVDLGEFVACLSIRASNVAVTF